MLLDGSFGEGGGQIVRTAIGLSAVTGEAVTIKNIRANRPKPGLNFQHLAAIQAVGMVCGAEVEGASVGSKEITFKPGAVEGGSVSVSVPTAGSLGLVLQAMLIACTAAKKEVSVSMRGGGTWGKWAPPVDYTKHVLAPLLAKMGYGIDVRVEKHGFYPTGGASVECVMRPAKLRKLRLEDAGKPLKARGVSIASRELLGSKVADRQAKAARAKIYERLRLTPDIGVEYAQADCVGSGILVWLECEHSVLGASCLGEKGMRAEDVGTEAAAALLKENGAVDRWAGDQLVPFLALAGDSALSVSDVTAHAKTNAWVAEQFTGKKFLLEKGGIRV